jgi:hypothetical protein
LQEYKDTNLFYLNISFAEFIYRQWELSLEDNFVGDNDHEHDDRIL